MEMNKHTNMLTIFEASFERSSQNDGALLGNKNPYGCLSPTDEVDERG